MRSTQRFSMSLVPGLFFVALVAHTAPAQTPGGAKSPTASANKAPANTAPGAKIKFRPYELIDERAGGLAVNRIWVPQDWKANGSVQWNLRDLFLPVRVRGRMEAPDGGSWIEFYPAEFFVWLDPPPRMQMGSFGGIHHPNITLPQAMVRYVIAPNRGREKNIRILGYRPVNDLPKMFPKAFPNGIKGEGICMRVQYDLGGSPVDEEFYGFMPPLTTLPPVPGAGAECHRLLLMVHSMGAKSGKLESVRPLLGTIATSIEPNPAWQQQLAQIQQAQIQAFKQNMAQAMQNWAQTENAIIQRGQAMSNAQHARIAAQSDRLQAQSDATIQRVDASLGTGRPAGSSYSAGSNAGFYQSSDGFDQNIRGTEHMQDQYGAVTNQYTNYNYHWTDGFGRYVHTNDPNFDANKYLNGSYQQMTPAGQ